MGTLRRPATRVGNKPIAQRLGNHFRPTQQCFETKGDDKAAAQAARHYMVGAQHRRMLIKFDVGNAFNRMRMDVFLRAIREKAPTM